MSLETDLLAAVGALCGNRCYPDTAPPDAARPYVTWQQVGGQVLNPIDGTVPGIRHARIQINAWAATRLAANALMNSIEDALRPLPLHGRPAGALIARYDEMTRDRGAQQDFEFWR